MPLKKSSSAGLGLVAILAPLRTGLVGSGVLLANSPVTAFLRVANPDDGRGLAERPRFGSVGTCNVDDAFDAFRFLPRGGVMLMVWSTRNAQRSLPVLSGALVFSKEQKRRKLQARAVQYDKGNAPARSSRTSTWISVA
jgi:hypothetical protein